MLTQKFLIFSLVLIVADCRHTKNRPSYLLDTSNILSDDFEDFLIESQQPFEARRFDIEPLENEKVPTEIQSVNRGSLGEVLDQNEEAVPRISEETDELSDMVFSQDNPKAVIPHPVHLRVTRQLQASSNTNPDGSFNLNGKLPLVVNKKTELTAIGSGNGLKPGGGYGSASAGLVLKNVNGHGASLSGTHTPNIGDQLTAAGKLNLVHTPNHNVDANAFVTRNMPSIPNIPNTNIVGGSLDYTHRNGHGASLSEIHSNLGDQLKAAGTLNLFHTPNHNVNANAFVSRTMPSNPNALNFNTMGGSLDYAFRDKVGASLGMSHTPLFQKTDYSASGNFNLHRTPTSSLDLSAGFSRSMSPFMPNRGWQPSGSLIYTRNLPNF